MEVHLDVEDCMVEVERSKPSMQQLAKSDGTPAVPLHRLSLTLLSPMSKVMIGEDAILCVRCYTDFAKLLLNAKSPREGSSTQFLHYYVPQVWGNVYIYHLMDYFEAEIYYDFPPRVLDMCVWKSTSHVEFRIAEVERRKPCQSYPVARRHLLLSRTGLLSLRSHLWAELQVVKMRFYVSVLTLNLESYF